MADAEPKRAQGWRKLAKQESASNGAHSSLLKKAMSINPSLKGGRKTEEVLSELQAAKQKIGVDPASPVKPARSSPLAPPDRHRALATLVAETKRWLAAELARIEGARAEAQKRKAALAADKKSAEDTSRAEVVLTLREADPTLALPMTKIVIEAHEPFLRRLQLDLHKLRSELGGRP